MKKSLIFLLLLLAGGSWFAYKHLQRTNKSSEERYRFTEHASHYSDEASIFLSEQVVQHHDEAFAASYQMWKFSPVSDLDLASHFDEQAYFRTLSELIGKEAKKEGQIDALAALLDIGQNYGVPAQGKIPTLQQKPPPTIRSPGVPPSKTQETGQSGQSSLNKPQLGDKRKIPNSRDHDND